MISDESPAYCVLAFDCQRPPYSGQYKQTKLGNSLTTEFFPWIRLVRATRGILLARISQLI
jgi:hypothetical protein